MSATADKKCSVKGGIANKIMATQEIGVVNKIKTTVKTVSIKITLTEENLRE